MQKLNISSGKYVRAINTHFYIVKMGFAGVYPFFLFLIQNIDGGYSLERPRQGGSNLYPQLMFSTTFKKYQNLK